MTDDRSSQTLATTPASTGWRERRKKALLWHEVPFDDWSIGGVPLRELVAPHRKAGEESAPEQRMSRLDPSFPATAVAGLRALLGGGPPDFDDGRIALLVCPVDLDLNCGTISARVVVHGDTVEWADVGWQVDYEPFAPEPDQPLLHFRFERSRYESLLHGLLREYEGKVAVPRPDPVPLDESRRR